MRILIRDNDGAKDLIRALVGAIGADSVFLDGDTHEVCIDEARGDVEPGRALGALGLWLDGTGRALADVRDGNRSYTVKRSSSARDA